MLYVLQVDFNKIYFRILILKINKIKNEQCKLNFENKFTFFFFFQKKFRRSGVIIVS